MVQFRVPTRRDGCMIYITGDTHGEFGWIEAFCRWSGICKEDVYASLLFVKDGEVFNLDGKQAIAMGGAYSFVTFHGVRKA